MRVGFTGTQQGMTEYQALKLRTILKDLNKVNKITEAHHGDCVGADFQFNMLVRAMFPNAKVHIHPPIKAGKRTFCDADVMHDEKDYLVRNHDIVDAVDILLATPKENKEVLRSGTWATIRYAKKQGKKPGVIFP